MFSIVNKRKIFFAIPIVIIIAGIISFAIHGGFNTDIDFTGGHTMAIDVITAQNKIDVQPSETAKPEMPAEGTAAPVEENVASAEVNAAPQQNVEAAETAEIDAEKSFATGSASAEGVYTSATTPLRESFKFNENEVREVLKSVGVNASTVQSSQDGFIIKVAEITKEKADEIKMAFADKFGQIKVTQEDKVAASMGKELWGKSLLAILITIILMLVYITFRFELLSGISAIVALAHDVLIILSVYAIFQLSVNTSFIAAVLTILGYSINATIVIFDRIRENKKFDKQKVSFGDVVDKSIFQSMTRSINTSVTTLLTIGMVYILGVESVKQFALPIIIGVVCGTYSSIFVSGPFWALIKGDKKSN